MLAMPQTYRRYAYPLATGQTTSYGSGTGVDDGALQKGIAKPTAAYTILTAGQYSGTTNIVLNGKTDVHSNACVYDQNTRLMWSRTLSASVGPASNGLIPWTTNANGEGVFTYLAAANAASLAGYTDWRICNKDELNGLGITETGYQNTTAFPSWGGGYLNIWSSSTSKDSITYANILQLRSQALTVIIKTGNYSCLLVRGGW
jgi:hypothetical protein